MSIPETLLVSQKQAAVIQIEQAIRLYHAGDLVCALTLAGAAEGALGPDSVADPQFFAFKAMKEKLAAANNLTEKDAVNTLNEALYFLKHYDSKNPDPHLLLKAVDPWVMIYRAVAKLQSLEPTFTSPTIEAFVQYTLRYATEVVQAAKDDEAKYASRVALKP
jgi:hypothetical protein